jgi:DNA-binding transcriptional ArsR family regulator
MLSHTARSDDDVAPDVWSALADPTRRTLIDRLALGAKSTSELGVGLSMSRFGVMKHLAVLERAGLVVTRKHGRVRMNHLNAAALQQLQSRWLSPHGAALARAADRFSKSLGEKIMVTPLPVAQLGAVDVALEWRLPVPAARVWSAMFAAPDVWWPASHRAIEGAKFSFDERLGGQLREELAGGQALAWYTIYAMSRERSLDLTGTLATRYGGPATSLLHIELEDSGNGCVLKLMDSVFGRLGPQFQSSVTEGWTAIIGEGLVPYAAKTKR